MQNLPEFTRSDFMEQRVAEKKTARDFQTRRHLDWNDNYELFRNKVKQNKLTQRQPVNIPVMKETIKTLLSKIDDPPNVEFKDKDGDQIKEIIVQEMWNDDFDRLNFEGIDLQDKKTVLLYGRGFKKMDWRDNAIFVYTPDIFDVVVDPLTDPLDLETARFVIHQNIFRSLRDILADPKYSAEGKKELKTYLTSKQGILQSGKNKEEYEKKSQRLIAMGVNSSDFPLFAGGDMIVNLTEHITNVWDSSQDKYVRRVVIYADDMVELYNETLKDCLGIEFYPYVSWGDDIETNDFWSDGVADLVRTPNKVLNVWYSQMIENRTLGNFNMAYYDATNNDYEPQIYEPGPGVMIPLPGKPQDTIMPVPIQKLDDNMTAMDYLTNIVERSTAATAIDKGVSEQTQQTLGEVQILVGKAMERTLSMQKFYRRAWHELAMKWYALLAANQGERTLYKASPDGTLWPKKVYPGEWKSESGYKVMVRSSSEQEQDQTKGIQRLMAIKAMFPGNPALDRIVQKRSLELVDLTPAELREVEDDQEKLQQQQAQMQQMQMQPQVDPNQPLLNEVQSKMQQFNQLTNAAPAG